MCGPCDRVGGHPLRHAFGRQRHERARRHQFRQACAVLGRNIAPRQTRGATEFARRQVDQHQVQRALAQSILGRCRFLARQRDLTAVAGSSLRPLRLDFGSVEPQLSRGPSPAVRILAIDTAVADTAQSRRVPHIFNMNRGTPGFEFICSFKNY